MTEASSALLPKFTHTTSVKVTLHSPSSTANTVMTPSSLHPSSDALTKGSSSPSALALTSHVTALSRSGSSTLMAVDI